MRTNPAHQKSAASPSAGGAGLQAAKAKAQIVNTIPSTFLHCLPITQAIQPLAPTGAAGPSAVSAQNLSAMSDLYPPLKEVHQTTNQTYERM